MEPPAATLDFAGGTVLKVLRECSGATKLVLFTITEITDNCSKPKDRQSHFVKWNYDYSLNPKEGQSIIEI